MSEKQIARILRHVGISLKWIPEYDRLINGHQIKSVGFGLLTRGKGKYRDALNMMLDVLSVQFVEHFGGVPNKEALEIAGKI